MKMKIILILLLCSLKILGQEKAEISFFKKVIDVGEVNAVNLPLIKVNFIFINSGKKALVIYKTKASCGCITPYWPKSPIKPNEKGMIRVVFDTKNQKGIFNKEIFIESNSTNDVVLLRIKGNIK